MSPEIQFLLTLLNSDNQGGHYTLKVALSIGENVELPEDGLEYPMEPESRKFLQSLLPLHCQYEIIEVERLFEVVVKR